VYSAARERMLATEVHELRTPNAFARVTGTIVTLDVEPPLDATDLTTRICVLAGAVTAGAIGGSELELTGKQCVNVVGTTLYPAPPPANDGPHIGRREPQ